MPPSVEKGTPRTRESILLDFSTDIPFYPMRFDEYAGSLREQQPEDKFKLKWVAGGSSTGQGVMMVFVADSKTFEDAVHRLELTSRGVIPRGAGYLYMNARPEGNGSQNYSRVIHAAPLEEFAHLVSKPSLDFVTEILPDLLNADGNYFTVPGVHVDQAY